MKKFLAALVLFFTFGTVSFAKAPVDLIQCDNGKIQLSTYTWDYLVAQSRGIGPQHTTQLNKILRWRFNEFAGLAQGAGSYDIANSLFHFADSILNPQRHGYRELWEEAAFGFGILEPKDLPNFIRSLCPGPQTKGLLAIKTFTRQSNLIFEYHQGAIDELKNLGEPALSQVIFRKWAENIIESDEAINNWVLWFHDKDVWDLVLSGNSEIFSKIRELLRNSLFSVTNPTLPICQRSKPFVKSIEFQLKNRCDFIKDSDLKSLTYYKLPKLNRAGDPIDLYAWDFSIHDFEGLENLTELDMSNIDWLGTALRSGMFRFQKNLQKMSFARSNLFHGVWPDLFYGIQTLTELDLQGTDVTAEIRINGLFEGIFSPHGKNNFLNLRQTQFRNGLTKGIFYGAKNIHHIDMSESEIGIVEENAFAGLDDLRSLKINEAQNLKDFAGSLNEADLPSLSYLELGAAYNAINWGMPLTNLETLKLTHGDLLKEGLPEFYPNLKILDLSGSTHSFLLLPKDFSRFQNLKTFRAMNLWNGNNYTHHLPTLQLPPALELLEYCHQNMAEIDLKYLAQELSKKHKGILIRTQYHCTGDWHEIQI